MSDTTLARPVGAIGLPDISAALRDLGFDVIGGSDDISADVASVRAALTDRQFAVLIANPPVLTPGLLGLVNNLAPRHPVVIVNFADPGPVVHAKARTLDLPDTIGAFVRVVNGTLSPDLRVDAGDVVTSRKVLGDATLEATTIPSAADEPDDDTSPWDAFGFDEDTTPVAPEPQGATQDVPQQTAVTVAADHAAVAEPPEPSVEFARADPTPPEPVPDPTPTHQVVRPLPDWMTDPASSEPTPVVTSATATQPPAAPTPVVDPTPPEPPTPQPAMPEPEPAHARAREPLPPLPPQIEAPTAPPRQPGVVIACTAAKGGVLKTTISRLLAQYAGSQGLRVVLVDANGGQDGQRKMMRVGDSLPSAYDYAVGATNWQSTISMPDEINAVRPEALTPVSFAAIFAPPSNVADHGIVTPQVYAELTRHAASIADVVIVDTQMVEAPAMRDANSFARSYLVPILTEAPNRWLLSLFDNNKEAFENLIGNGTSTGVLADFVNFGVPRTNSLILATLVAEGVTFDDTEFASVTAPFGRFLGHTTASASMSGSLNAGLNDHTDPAVATALRNVLSVATGLPQFEPPATAPRRGLFRRGGK